MRPLAMNWFWRGVAVVAAALVGSLRWRVDVVGLHNVPRHGGAVLAFNHHSYLDFVMVGWAVVRRLRRPIRFLAKREIWESPRVGWIVRLGGAVPVDRDSAGSRRQAFEAAVAALRAGDLVTVAPEQTISRSFELLPFRTGAVRMAQLAGVPLIPVVGWGTQRVATKGVPPRLALRLPVTVRYGEPLHVGPADDVVDVTAKLQAVAEGMLDAVQRDYPDGTPAGAWWVPARLGGAAPPHDAVLRAQRQRTGRSGSDASAP